MSIINGKQLSKEKRSNILKLFDIWGCQIKIRANHTVHMNKYILQLNTILPHKVLGSLNDICCPENVQAICLY